MAGKTNQGTSWRDGADRFNLKERLAPARGVSMQAVVVPEETSLAQSANGRSGGLMGQSAGTLPVAGVSAGTQSALSQAVARSGIGAGLLAGAAGGTGERGVALQIDSAERRLATLEEDNARLRTLYQTMSAGEREAGLAQMDASEQPLRDRLAALEAQQRAFQTARYDALSGREDFGQYSAYTPELGEDYTWVNMVARNGAQLREAGPNGDLAANMMGIHEMVQRHLTEDEVGVYNYLYATQGKDAANGYLDYMTPELNRRDREGMTEQWQQIAREDPVGSSVVSVLMSPAKGLSYLGQAVDFLADGEIDQNAPYNRFSYVPSTIRGQVSRDIEERVEGFWGKAGSFAYQTGMSMGDFLLNAGIGGASGLGGTAAEALTLGIMGTGAAADATIEAKDRGLSDGQAFLLGTVAGAAEIITEKVSLETLLDKTALGRNGLTYFLKNVLAEGSEEVASDVINLVADVLVAQDESQWQAAIDSYTAQGMDPETAFWHAARDQALEMGLSFLGGGLSGGVMSAGAIGLNAAGREYDLRRTGSELDAQSTIYDALQGDPEGEGYQLARQLQDRLNSGERVSNRQLGRLYEASTREGYAPEIGAALLAEVTREGPVSNREAQDVLDTPGAVDILTQEAGLQLRDDMTRAQRRSAVKAAAARWARSQSQAQNQVQEQAPVREQEPRSEETPRTAELPGIAQAAGEAVREENRQRMAQAQDAFGEHGSKALLAAYDGTEDPAGYYGGFAVYYQAGLAGQELEQVRGSYGEALSQAQRFAAWSAGRNDAQRSLERETAAGPRFSAAPGLVRGQQTGSLTAAEAGLLDRLGRQAGVRIEVADSLRGGEANGVYLPESGTIRLAADAEHPLLTVAAHELTHHLQSVAPAEYRAFREYANRALSDRLGTAAVEELRERYARHGETLSYEQAMDEAAAEFAQSMVEDGALFRELAQEDRSLAQRVLDAVKAFLDKVRALLGREGRAAADSAARQRYGVDMATMEEAARLWEEALEATERAVRGEKNTARGAETGGGEERYSGKMKEGLATPTGEQAPVNTPEARSGTALFDGSVAQDGGDVNGRFSLKQFEDGTRYVEVDTDQELFEGLTTDQMRQKARDIILSRFKGTVIGTDYTAYVNKRSAEHYVYPANRRMADQIKRDKLQASPELDNILAASVFRENVPDDGRHPSATGGIDKLDTVFRVNGRLYQAEITVLVTNHGRVFYDLTKFRDITRKSDQAPAKSAAATDSDVSGKSIPQPGGDVNGKFSLKEDSGLNAEAVAALREENALLRERVERWRAQTRRTPLGATDRQAVDKAALALLRRYDSQMDAGELGERLQSLYDQLGGAKNGNVSSTEPWQQAQSIAREIAESAVAKNDELYQDYKELRDYLRSTEIVFGQEYQGDIPDFQYFRRRNFGRMRLKTQGRTNVDGVYQELSAMWPEFFNEQQYSHPSDQLAHIDEVLDGIYTVTEYNPYSLYMEEAVQGIANDIMDTFFELPQAKPTMADKQAKRLQELRERNREAVNRAITGERMAGGRELEKQRQRFEAREAALTDKQARRLQELRERQQAREAARRERHSAAALRGKITRHARSLGQKLLRPGDKANIPENLRPAVAALLNSINLESGYAIDPETGAHVTGAEAARGTPTGRTEAFRALREQYMAIVQQGGELVLDPSLLGDAANGIPGSFDQVIAMGDTPLANLNAEQLETIWQVLRAVEHSVTTAGKLLSESKYERVADLAQALRDDTRGRKAKRSKTRRHLTLELETPCTFFSHFGAAGRGIYRMLRDAQDRQQVLVDRVAEAVGKVADPKTARELERSHQTFQTEGGAKLTLTTAQVMELYLLSQRPQARGHLLVGGIVQPEVKSARVRRGTESIRLTEGDLTAITGSLSEAQREMAEGLQGLTAGILAEMGNEASMAAYGYRKFTEAHYWPIKSAHEGVYVTVEQGGDNPHTTRNTGMARQTVPNANNPLDLPGVFDTFARHAGEMTDYAAWLCVMEDTQRLYNFRYAAGPDAATGYNVKNLLERVAGAGAQEYWENLMKNIQNGIREKSDSRLGDAAARAVGSFKGAAVGANLRVVIQQPTAFFRAAAVLGPQDMARGLVKGVTGGSGWKKAKQYSPIAMRKDAGGFDISNPLQMKETLFDSRTRVRRFNDALSWGAGKADAVTWGRLWNACEWATSREHPALQPGSEAFYEAVNRRFTDMIDQTQVVDGVLQRAGVMRSKNAVVQQATSFMGEPLMSLNLTMRAWDQLRYEQDSKKRGRAIKVLGRAALALIVTNAVNALAQSLVDAVRSDDRDKKYLERVLAAFTGLEGDEENGWDVLKSLAMEGNLLDNMNPLGQIPFVKDALSLVQGYDVARTDMEVVSDLIRAGQTAAETLGGNGKRTVPYAMKELLCAGAKLFGIPVGNLTRDIWGFMRTIAVETESIPAQYELERAIYRITNENNKGRYYDLLFQALVQGDMESYWRIREDLMEQMGLDGPALDTALRSRAKNAPEGTLSQEALDVIYQLPGGPQDEEEERFGAVSLAPEAYREYAEQRGEDYRAMADSLGGNPIFIGMSDEVRYKVLQAAAALAKEQALEDASGGQYRTNTVWIANMDIAERAGVEPWEYVLFHVAYNMFSGAGKKDQVRDWLEDFDGLTEAQRAALWGTVYSKTPW